MSGIRIQKDVNAKKIKSLVLLGIIICVCLVLCLVAYLAGDSTAPKLDFTYAVATINFSETDPLEASDFLNGVTASDSTDGDLTKDIYVSNIRYADDNRSVTVSYGVRDHSGNVTTAQRIYNINGNVASVFEQIPSDKPNNDSTADETTSQAKTTEAQTTEETTTIEPTEEITEAPTEEITEAPTEEVTEEQPLPAETVDPAKKPVLILTVNEVTYPVGTTGVDFNQFIAQLYDDVDTYYSLYTSLWLENMGKVDFNTPGTYVVTYHVKDSEGNWNDPAYLTVYIV